MSAGHAAVQRLDASPSSVRAARHAVCEVVGGTLHDQEIEQLLLATSELVTNALEHGAPPIELRIECDNGHVRVEVRDGSPLPPRERSEPPGPSEVRGRGLVIVDRCTNRWGVEGLAEGKTVWFEIDA